MPAAFLSLVSLDEHLSHWLDTCSLSEKTTEPSDADALLRKVMAFWPSLLRLLTERTVEQSNGDALDPAGEEPDSVGPAAALPLLVAACDVLMSVSRNVPIATVRSEIDSLQSEAAYIQTNAVPMISIEVTQAKEKFIKTYGGIGTEIHSCVDYWPVWEQQVRNDALDRLTGKVRELQASCDEKWNSLDQMEKIQAQVQEAWWDIRAQILLSVSPAGKDSTHWTSSSSFMKGGGSDDGMESWRKKMARHEAEALLPIRDSTTLTRSHLVEVQRALSRLHITAGVAATQDEWQGLKFQVVECINQLGRYLEHGRERPPTAEPPIMQRPSKLADRKASVRHSLIVGVASLVDRLLRLLQFQDRQRYELVQRKLRKEVEHARDALRESLEEERRIMAQNPKAISVDLLDDEVVRRFRVDGMTVLAEAALQRARAMVTIKHKEKVEGCERLHLAAEARLAEAESRLEAAHAEPWERVMKAWQLFTGLDPPRSREESVEEMQESKKRGRAYVLARVLEEQEGAPPSDAADIEQGTEEFFVLLPYWSAFMPRASYSGVGEFAAYPRGKHDHCQRIGILSFFAVVMIVYLYIDARRARLPSREEKPIRGAESDFALAQVGPMIDASRINAELRPVAVVKKDKYGEEQGTVVLKMKLSTLENEPSTEPPAPETTQPLSTRAVPKTVATTPAATPAATEAVHTTAVPKKAPTTPEPIEFELVPVTNAGQEKGAEEGASDDVRLETIASSEGQGGKSSSEEGVVKALPREERPSPTVDVTKEVERAASKEAGGGAPNPKGVGAVVAEGGGRVPSKVKAEGVGEVKAEGGAASEKGNEGMGAAGGGGRQETEPVRTTRAVPGVSSEPQGDGRGAPPTDRPKGDSGAQTRAEDMAAIVKRLEKLEAEVGSKTEAGVVVEGKVSNAGKGGV
ncbi:hypothetical protein FOZ61_000598 [Perkinsus olseni]|uniref:Uncharacterized protein n=1 Tax=Perkinsus olseni TaxID=32597 RepID=A0A7J6LZT1_PEROL|nr:hypothetical protein FOZ61_000598 [Perkinsus olseni]